MANTYSQIFIHIIFSVKHRDILIKDEWKDRLYKYISSIIDNRSHKTYAINGTKDHIHILLSQNPERTIPDLVRDIKTASSKWIKENNLSNIKFEWQKGYGCFSVSKSNVSKVIEYLNNQEKHHRNKSFNEEYLGFLKKYEVEYNPKYLFDLSE